ncbi:NAD(P)/FAD-dependent oxidoreductase [Kibdelosporangium philippinense]|uniref:Pyridine nucleotide-disulfide oxidoreductase domain-containing protein 2 n=1 Tax=Kibdelosporangium philippinense TaxID=211113 RepID=A0ABS8ZKP4_9PSEU|nr:NAD(P)/FAD-dependent oxidoreductase [Kibdelosporangium philippinense]MCE7008132.1 NAD(P)/FAD-dependent oxidoreductase [Kibdelosporangium philippinense]
MGTWDAIIVGSGHNALVAGALLARDGWSVLVLEEQDRAGGLVRTDELTLPGFHHDTYSSAHPLFTGGPAFAELGPELTELGLEYLQPRYWTGVSMPGQGTAVLSRDLDETLAEAERLAPGDGAKFSQLLKDFEPYIGPVFELMGSDLATKSREIHDLFHEKDGRFSEFAHLFTRTARDLLTDTFTSPVLRGTLAPWALHLGRGPEDVNSALWVILVQVALGAAGMPTPKGGSGQLATTLTKLIEKHGGSVQTGQRVDRILVEDGRARGVRAGGEKHRARRAVIASVNPDQLYLELLESVPDNLRRQAGKYRYGRGCFQIHVAMSEPPRFADERLMHTGQPHLSGGLDALSRSVNEVARGLLPVEPTISFDAPSTVDPRRCPPGKAVARLQILDVPTNPTGDAAGSIEVDGWTEDVKRLSPTVSSKSPGGAC